MKLLNSIDTKTIFKWFKTSVWAFPLVLFLVVLLLSALKIHGSSIGVYRETLYPASSADPDLIFGSPKPIRSDEWRIWTPFSALQTKTGFPAFNENLGSGRDVTIQPDTPVYDWSSLFRPHNWSFFVLPLEQAFALSWWIVLYALIVSAYFFVLRFSHNNKKLAVLLSLALGLSPFLLWWYQTVGFLSMAYALIGIMVSLRIINNQTLPKLGLSASRLVYVTTLSYVGVSFALLIYVPFLIPVAISAAAFLAGYLIMKKLPKKELFKRLSILGAAVVIIGAILAGFYFQHKSAITAITHSAYPGQRVIKSGGQKPLAVLDGFLMPVLQSESRGENYYSNQSESSNFILLLPFLLLPGFLLLYFDWRKNKRVCWPLLAVQIVGLLFIARLYIPFGDPFYKLLLLDKVPPNRLLEGLGFAGFLQLVLFTQVLDKLALPFKKLLKPALGYSALCFMTLLLVGWYVINTYPNFLKENLVMIGLAGFFTSIITAFLLNKKLLGAGLLLAFTMTSSFSILPIYRGLDFFQNSSIIQKIQSISKPGDDWVTFDSLNYESLPLTAGRGSVGGVQIYSDPAFWQQIDKDKDDAFVYNRQGHAIFLSNTLPTDPSKEHNITTAEKDLELVKSNVFKIKFTCSDFTYKNIDYALATSRIDNKHACLQLVDSVSYPKQTFYIYKVTSPSHGTSSKPSF